MTAQQPQDFSFAAHIAGAAMRPIAAQGRSLYLDFCLFAGQSSRLIIEGKP